MGKLVIVENDKVEGTDKHKVLGLQAAGSPPPAYSGFGQFDYIGKMTEQMSDFVTIDGKPVALKNSKSALNSAEDIAPTGKHSGPMSKDFIPLAPAPNTDSLQITDPIGTGNPSVTSGSLFVKIDSIEILLDGDKIDTCDGLGVPMNSIVTADNQDFVFCSE